MRKRKDFSLDEKTIDFLREMAKDDCTTMSALLERLILKECKRRMRRDYIIYSPPLVKGCTS